jgi:hypothetical protein
MKELPVEKTSKKGLLVARHTLMSEDVRVFGHAQGVLTRSEMHRANTVSKRFLLWSWL